MKHKQSHISIGAWIQWAFFFLLLGFGMKFLSGEGPFSGLFFHEASLNQLIGCAFLFFSLVIWFKNPLWNTGVALLSFFILLADSLTAFQAAQYVPEQLIEHAAKLLLPLLVFSQRFTSWNRTHTLWSVKIIVALTFIGHGLFAIGWHFVPGSFYAMTTSILHINGNQATDFLVVVGLLDFIAAISLFLTKSIQRVGLIYLVIWGILTTLARTAYPISLMDFEPTSLYHGITGTVYRIPHAMLPLLLFSYAWRNRQVKLGKLIQFRS